MSHVKNQRLGLPRLLALSSLAFPLSGIGLPLGVYLAPFYADEVGLGVALTGTLFMVLRFYDMATDSVVGFLVDRYRTPFGRARPWIVAAVPILMVSAFFLYLPPRNGVGGLYFAGWLVLFYFGSTLLQVARNAWVTDLAADYDDRSRYFVVIEIISILSMLFLLLLPVLVAGSEGGDRFAQLGAMGLALIVSLPITAFLACALVPDRPPPAATVARLDPAALIGALKNRVLLQVLGLEVLIGMAISTTAALYLFVADSVFGLSDQQASLLLVVFFLSSVAGLPVWMELAKRTEKHKAVCVAVLMSAGSYGVYYAAAPLGGFWPFAMAAVVNGFAFTAPLVIGRSMTADVVEQDFVATGINRAGLFFGLNSAAYKIGASLSIGAAYLLVGLWAGFEAGADNPPEAVHRLLLIFCLLPAALYLLTYLTIRHYPLDRAMQAKIAAERSARTQGQAEARRPD